MAVAVGVRANICTIDVPSCTRDVAEPHQASGVRASDPYASAVHTEANPKSSAARTCSTASAGGPAPQYPNCNPSFTTFPRSPIS
jgi:hypothetical protein